MEQKFVKFEEAIEKLGISAERLNQLREEGELRAYRDGSSWKFRADEIDRLATDGVPDPPPPSDIGLVSADELIDASPLESLPELDEDFKLADLDLDDTVTAGGSDALLNLASDEPSDPSDSILLSDETLGASNAAPPSTIIGKSELAMEDADLELVTDDDELDSRGSDVRLAAGASDVLSAGIAGSGVLDDEVKESSHASAFENLEELEIDLAAESSRILSPEDVAQVRGKGSSASAQQQAKDGDSDLTLGELELEAADEGTDPVPEELEKKDKSKKAAAAASSDLELATDEDEFVLADAGGSDITLDSGDSGINLISPADSGLALDDIPLEMGGSAILESLNLSSPGDPEESEISLVGSDIAEKPPARQAPKAKPAAALQTDDDFRLTPLGETDDDGDSSSQVIALDADMDDLGGPAAGILGDDAFAEVADDDMALTEDYGATDDAGLAVTGYAPVAREGEYTVLNILALGSCFALLMLGVTVMMDMVRNIWGWDENLALNDSLLNSLLGLFGMS
jgi:excisionase family DNA binding protein